MAFCKALGVNLSKQSFLSPGFQFHMVPPVSPSLLIFPLCARPGHLYQSVRPVSKGKVSTVEGRGHSCYSRRAWWFSGAGCRIFQKQLCASGADGEPDLKEFLSLSIGMLGLVPRLTQTHTQPEISALSPHRPPFLPCSEHIPLAQRRSFHHSG